jgi:hypothetical protein
VSFRSSSATFFEPANDRGGRDAEGAPEPAQARSLLVSAQDLLLALLGVAVGRGVFATLTPAGVTKVLLLAIIWGEAVFDDIVASAMRAGDAFGNHALTLTRRSHHSSLVHYRSFFTSEGVGDTLTFFSLGITDSFGVTV